MAKFYHIIVNFDHNMVTYDQVLENVDFLMVDFGQNM